MDWTTGMPSGTGHPEASTPLLDDAVAGAIDRAVRVASVSGTDRQALDSLRRQLQLDLLARGCEVVHLSAQDLPAPNALAARLAIAGSGDATEVLRVYAKGEIRVALLVDSAEDLSGAVVPLLNSWLRSSDIGPKLLIALFGSAAAAPIASRLAEGLAPGALSFRSLGSPPIAPGAPAAEPSASPSGAPVIAEPVAFTEALIETAHDAGPEVAAPTAAGSLEPAPLQADSVKADRAAEETDPGRPLVWHPDDDAEQVAANPEPLTSEHPAPHSQRSAPKRWRGRVLTSYIGVAILAAAGSWVAVHYRFILPPEFGNRLDQWIIPAQHTPAGLSAPSASHAAVQESQVPSANPTTAASTPTSSGPSPPAPAAASAASESAATEAGTQPVAPASNSAAAPSPASPEEGGAGAPVRLRPGFTTNPSEQTATTERVAPGAIAPPAATPPVEPPKTAAAPAVPAANTPVVPAPPPPAGGPGARGQDKPEASVSPRPEPVGNATGPSGAGRTEAGPGLLVIAKSGDTLRSLYDRVYRGQEAPPFETVAAMNQGDLHNGDVVVFPAPRGGWRREPSNSAK